MGLKDGVHTHYRGVLQIFVHLCCVCVSPTLSISSAMKYCIAGNFWGKKPSWILQFCSYLWKFSSQNLGRDTLLAWQKWAIHERFLGKNCIFQQTAKSFLPQKFPHYTVCWCNLEICDRIIFWLLKLVAGNQLNWRMEAEFCLWSNAFCLWSNAYSGLGNRPKRLQP